MQCAVSKTSRLPQLLILAYVSCDGEVMVWENPSWSLCSSANCGVVCSTIPLLRMWGCLVSVFSCWKFAFRITVNMFPWFVRTDTEDCISFKSWTIQALW